MIVVWSAWSDVNTFTFIMNVILESTEYIMMYILTLWYRLKFTCDLCKMCCTDVELLERLLWFTDRSWSSWLIHQAQICVHNCPKCKQQIATKISPLTKFSSQKCTGVRYKLKRSPEADSEQFLLASKSEIRGSKSGSVLASVTVRCLECADSLHMEDKVVRQANQSSQLSCKVRSANTQVLDSCFRVSL